MGCQPMMHPLASTWGIAFYVLTLSIIALGIRLDLKFLGLLKVGISGTLETRSRQHKVMSKII